MIGIAFNKLGSALWRIASRAGEEMFPFVTYFITSRCLRAAMNGEKSPVSPDTLANYRNLDVSDLEKRMIEEHDRAKSLDEKTFKMTFSLALGLTILGSLTAVLLGSMGASTIATLMRFGITFSILYIFFGGCVALASLRTLQTFGYGTGFRIELKTTSAPAELYVDALLRQEKANQIRQVRNEAAFQALRNGFVLFGIVLILYLLVLTGMIHTTLPVSVRPPC